MPENRPPAETEEDLRQIIRVLERDLDYQCDLLRDAVARIEQLRVEVENLVAGNKFLNTLVDKYQTQLRTQHSHMAVPPGKAEDSRYDVVRIIARKP